MEGGALNHGASPVHHVAMDHRRSRRAAASGVVFAGLLLAMLPARTAHAGDLDMEIAFDVGWVPEKVHSSTAVPIPGATTPDGRPAGILGDNSMGVSGASVGGNAAIMFPNFGPGLPRMFFWGDAAVFLGRKGDTRFDLYDTTPGAADTGVTLKRNFAVDLALGGLFPLCREPSCLDLRIFFGATFLHQTITTSVDETSVGGKKEDLSGNKMKPSAFLAALVSIPFSAHLRLQLGAMFRSLSSVTTNETSGTGRTYATTIDGGVETQLTAGLAIPFAL